MWTPLRSMALVGLALAAPLSGQERIDRESLAGLQRIRVDIVGLSEPSKEGGLRATALEGFLVSRLREAGVPAVPPGVPHLSRRRPYLQLDVDVLSAAPREWIYSLSLRLYQQTCIQDFPALGSRLAEYGGCMATATWEWDALGVTGKWIRRVVRDEASGLTDRFVSDYLAANP